jgi:3-oxoacyl-[acyl-carrier protein] reductase
MDFSNKVVLVTGAGRGIGKEIARKYGEQGAKLVLVTSSEESFRALKEFEEQGFEGMAFSVDVRNTKDVEEMFKQVVEKYGQIDILVNNAGITRDKLILRMSEDDWDSVMDINLKGTFNCTKAAIKYMSKKKFGRIVNISSIVGVMGNPGQSNYVASKAGMIGFTKSIAKEYAARGINCNAIAPGFIQTKMTDILSEEVKENYINSIPQKRFGTPEDVANAVMFLSSDLAKYITGQILNIDGGLVM